MNKIIIIGGSHHNTYGLVRCFGEFGVKPDVILYGNPKSYILSSNFINMSHVTNDAKESLLLLKEKYTKAIVIACTDEIASLMDEEYDNLHDRFSFFNCGSTGTLTYFMDKVVQTTIASSVGLKVPQSVEGNPIEIKTEVLSYPCIIKPLESIHGGKNIQICRNVAETTDALKTFDPESKVMIQQYIEKDYEMVVVGMSYNNDVYIPAYIHKHRDTKGGTTYSTVKPIDGLPLEIVTSCKQLVMKMAYQGLFGIELLRKGGDFFFVEVNLRNDATTYAVAVAGCNLPLAYCKLINNENATNILSRPIRQIDSMVEFKDVIHVLKRNVSLFTWLMQKRESECRYFLCKEDPLPYKIKRNEFFRFILRMILNRI